MIKTQSLCKQQQTKCEEWFAGMRHDSSQDVEKEKEPSQLGLSTG